MVKCFWVFGMVFVCGCWSARVRADSERWWPTQAVPKGLVCTPPFESFEPVTSPGGQVSSPEYGATHILVQSVSGLAAKAVNEGRGDEMVWIGSNNLDYQEWYARMVRRLKVEVRGTFEPWALVDRFVAKGIVKGYILYRYDFSEGDNNKHRPGMDRSVNVATSLAGLMDAVLIEEGQEERAKQHGLKMLFDARDKTQQWCFETYRDRFNRKLLCTQDPKKPHIRDLTIAQKAFVLYGYDEPAVSAMKWLEPLSPIAGWNGGDEDDTTKMSSIYGHVQTATDWCINLPILMAGTENATIPTFKSVAPGTIDWNDRRGAVNYAITDGDNVQWLMGGYCRGQGSSWWSSPDRGKIPFGWSCCFTHLVQVCPEVIEYLHDTQTPNDWFIEWGGGYYYPEQFGRERPDRWDLLARHARRTWALMKKTNTRIIGFNFYNLESEEAKKAYEVFVREMPGLLAIYAFQYYPYEGGAGKIFWIKDASGIEVPVITARYSIWEGCNKRPRCGTPAKIAREIQETVAQAPADDPQTLHWSIIHCWSWFRKSPGPDEDAENMPQERAFRQGGVRGYTPAVWCAERLPQSVRIVSPEELVWRIRMKHNPEQTRKLLAP